MLQEAYLDLSGSTCKHNCRRDGMTSTAHRSVASSSCYARIKHLNTFSSSQVLCSKATYMITSQVEEKRTLGLHNGIWEGACPVLVTPLAEFVSHSQNVQTLPKKNICAKKTNFVHISKYCCFCAFLKCLLYHEVVPFRKYSHISYKFEAGNKS